jgi:PTH1 family peptidyl-tRNA hydrolase
LIAGLGNIGPEYENTRHNIGFTVVEYLASRFDVSFESSRLASVAHFKIKGRSITLIKPTVYMNNSGKSVHYWLNHLHIKDYNFIVVTDDIALPFGKLRIKPQGSSGGHNGLKSLEQHLSSSVYPRMRIGIGNNFPKGGQANFVLGKFTSDESALISSYLEKACDALLCFCTMDIGAAMNLYNA